MRRLRHRLRILRLDVRIVRAVLRLCWVWCRIWCHCLRLRTTPGEFRRQVRLRRLTGRAPDLGCGC